jgi:hypothetical protein
MSIPYISQFISKYSFHMSKDPPLKTPISTITGFLFLNFEKLVS